MKLDSLLQKFCSIDEVEYVRGDLEELFHERLAQVGRTRASYEYARDVLSVCWSGLVKRLKEGDTMNFHLHYPSKRLAIIGLVGLLAPGSFLLAVLLEEGFGISFFSEALRLTAWPPNLRILSPTSPILLLGGCLLAFLLNLCSVCNLSVRVEQKALVSTLRLEPKLVNLLIIAASLLFLAIFVGYAFVENYKILRTHT